MTQWVRSKAFDGFFLMSGLWCLVAVTVLEQTGGLTNFHYVLAVLFWIGHRLATTYLAFCKQAYQGLLKEQRTRFMVVPGLVMLSVFVILMIPESVLPIPILYRLLLFAGIDFIWEFYHFTMQHYGVISVYRIRAGQDPGAVDDKRREKLFAIGVFGGGIPLSVTYHALKGFAGTSETFPIPTWAPTILQVVGITLALGLTIRACLLELRGRKASIPKVLYMASLGIPVALTFAYDSMGPGLLIIAIQHWLVAVGLSIHMASGKLTPPGQPNAWYRIWNVVNRSPWTVLIIMAIGSAFLAPIMEFSDVERRYVMRAVRGMWDPSSEARNYVYWGAHYLSLLEGLGRNTVVMFFVAMGFAFGYQHYLIDRAIFRFSNADTRKVSGPLLFQKN